MKLASVLAGMGLVGLLPATGVTQDVIPGRQRLRMIDLNRDGMLDRLRNGPDGSLEVSLNVGGREFEPIVQQLPPVIVTGVLAVDLDEDGYTDLYLVGRQANVALVGDGTGHFVEATDELGLADSGMGVEAELVDIDGDGTQDVLLHNRQGDVIFWGSEAGSYERDASTPMVNAAQEVVPGAFLLPPAERAERPALDGSRGRRDAASDRSRRPVARAARTAAPQNLPDTRTVVPPDSVDPAIAIPFCAKTIEDVSTGDCIPADSTPTLGSLYPLGLEFNIDALVGRVGMGTTTPLASLHVAGDEGLLVTGTLGTGNVPVEGPGVRMIWYPGKAAFRAGRVEGDEWDDASVGSYSVAFGMNNVASGTGATVGGGYCNEALGDYAAIAGGGALSSFAGSGNLAVGDRSFVGGGIQNTASGGGTVVGGGCGNEAFGSYSVISGGGFNCAGTGYAGGAEYAAVVGGYINEAFGRASFVGGGERNCALGAHSSVLGGLRNFASSGAVVCGGGGFFQGNAATGGDSFIGAGSYNFSTGSSSAVVAGFRNSASGSVAGVVAGWGNTASGRYSFVGGGGAYAPSNKYGNRASGRASNVVGGTANIASGDYASIGGGGGTTGGNTASGSHSVIPGGQLNTAAGAFSFAAGRRAMAAHDGAFVWGDSFEGDKPSSAPDEFNVYCSGGARFFSNSGATTGVLLAPGGGSWTAVSDREAKENFEEVDTQAVLEKVAAMPLATWNYKEQSDSVRHMGPMAQDFYAAFGLGLGDKTIDTIDPNGVALAAIQGLHDLVRQKDARIESLEARQDAMERQVAQLLKRLEEQSH